MQTSYKAGPQHTRKLFCASHLQLPHAERIFSLLKSSFSDNQNLALEDYIEVSLMLQWEYLSVIKLSN